MTTEQNKEPPADHGRQLNPRRLLKAMLATSKEKTQGTGSAFEDRTNKYTLDNIKATPPLPSLQKPTPEVSATKPDIVAAEENAGLVATGVVQRSSTATKQSPSPEAEQSPVTQAEQSPPTEAREPLPPPGEPNKESPPALSITPFDPLPTLPRSSNPSAITTPAPALPASWTSQHDRAICYLDVRGYSTRESVRKLRSYFPELRTIGSCLTPATLEMRLRQLDQNPEITYWGDAMKEVLAGVGELKVPGATSDEKNGTAGGGAREESASEAKTIGVDKGKEEKVKARPSLLRLIS